MIICATCGTEMTCAKNGVGLDFGMGCVHQADVFKCECGAAVLIGNPRETVDPNYEACEWYFQVHEANMNADSQYAPHIKRWALAGKTPDKQWNVVEKWEPMANAILMDIRGLLKQVDRREREALIGSVDIVYGARELALAGLLNSARELAKEQNERDNNE